MKQLIVTGAIGLIALSAAAAPLSAQGNGWYLGPFVAWSDFTGGARAGNGATLELSSRLQYGVSMARQTGPWRFELAVSWAPGHLSTRDSTGGAFQIDILGQSFARLQFAPLAGHRLAAIGEGALALSAGPVLSLWSGEEDIRPRLGGQAQLSLSAPLGRLVLRNYIAWAIEGSVFTEDELGDQIERRAVSAISLGIEVGWKL